MSPEAFQPSRAIAQPPMTIASGPSVSRSSGASSGRLPRPAVARLGRMVEDGSPGGASVDDVDAPGPGIEWEPGDEDYPFPALAAEPALEYLGRWLDTAGYARIERAGARFIHEEDVANLFNHVTADVDLLRSRLEQYGDHVVVANDHAETLRRIEAAIALLSAALDTLRGPRDR